MKASSGFVCENSVVCVSVCVQIYTHEHLREEPGELAEEPLPPAARKVNLLPTTFDAAADAGSLLFAVRTNLKHAAHRVR